jgi:hypothetical protein
MCFFRWNTGNTVEKKEGKTPLELKYIQLKITARIVTSAGSPNNLRGSKSDSGSTIPGGSISAPLGLVGT